MPDARHPDVGAILTGLAVDAGLELVDAWAEAPAWCGPGPVAEYLEAMTEMSPGDEPVLLPPLVTVVARRAPPGPAAHRRRRRSIGVEAARGPATGPDRAVRP